MVQLSLPLTLNKIEAKTTPYKNLTESHMWGILLQGRTEVQQMPHVAEYVSKITLFTTLKKQCLT